MFKHITVAVATLLIAGLAFGQQIKSSGLATAPTPEASSDLWVENVKGGGYSIEFVNADSIAGLQFDIRDDAIKAGGFSCGGTLSSAFQSSCTLHAEDGFLRVIVFSMNAADIPDSTVFSVSVDRSGFISKQTRPSISGVIFSDSQGRNITPDHLN